MKKLILILILALINLSIVSACGGDVQCECWASLSESQTMWYDLECEGGIALEVTADNVILDCNGHTISGNGINFPEVVGGIRINEGTTNVTIKNCNMQGFDNGFFISGNQGKIEGNNISGYGYAGIRVNEGAQSTSILENVILNGSDGIRDFSGGSSIIGNKIVGCEYAYAPEGANQNFVQSNTFEGNRYGIFLLSGGSSYNTISHNIFNNSEVALGFVSGDTQNNSIYHNDFYGNMISVLNNGGNSFYDNIFLGNENTQNHAIDIGNHDWNTSFAGNGWDDFESNPGYPEYYLIEGDGGAKDWKAQQYVSTECGEIITEDKTLFNNLVDCQYDGLIIEGNNIVLDCNGHTIQGADNEHGTGVFFQGYNNITVKNCYIKDFNTGIEANTANENSIFNNNVNNSNWFGIRITTNSNENKVFDNIVEGSEGIDNGITLDHNSYNNQVYSNELFHNGEGVWLTENANTNLIFNNSVHDNHPYGGILVRNSYSNLIWDNVFINNENFGNITHAREDQGSMDNLWNNSEIGNFWDDFEINPGYPNYYEILGDGNGVDWKPWGVISPLVDPDYSYITLTNGNYDGLSTCPAGDGIEYQYLRIVLRDYNNLPLTGISSNSFVFITSETEDTEYYGNLSLSFIPYDSETDANGEIRFKIKGDTSIQGNVAIEVLVEDVLINDQELLLTNTFDKNFDGEVSLTDLAMFASDYNGINWRSDYNWDGEVSLPDFGMFAAHYHHAPGRLKTGEIPKDFLKKFS
jgi:parallel beta-helix repeat protein